MTTPLFQQLLAILKECEPEEHFSDIILYEVLIDEVYNAVERNVKFFTVRFDNLLNLYYTIFQNRQTQGINLMECAGLFEIFIMMVEAKPALIKNNQNRLLSMIQKLFELFNSIDFQMTQQWMKPPQGYSEDEDFTDEVNLTKQIMSFFDRTAMAYTYENFIVFFNGILPGCFNNSDTDWKSKYTLLMVMSQLGQDLQSAKLLRPYVQCGINSSTHPHPKVRYAVLHMFGQMADDMKPEFQFQFGQQILPIIINLAKDQVPRVQGHAMACLTNFLQDFEFANLHIVSPYFDQIISIAEGFAMNAISLVKQNTISTLASLSTINQLNDTHVQKIMNIINYFLTNEAFQAPEYYQLINQTIQCLSMVLFGQPNQRVQKYLGQTINVMNSVKGKVSAVYFVNSWSRLCLKYQNFTDLSTIFPYILSCVNQMIDANQSQLQSTIGGITNTITSFKGNIRPYANEIVQICKNGIPKLELQNQKQKSLLYDILNQLVKVMKSQAPNPEWQELAKSILTLFMEQVQKNLNIQVDVHQEDYLNLQSSFQGLKGIIQNVNSLFNHQSLVSFSQRLVGFVDKINAIIAQAKQDITSMQINITNITLNNDNNDEMDQDDYQMIIKTQQQNIKRLYDARLVIPDIFEAIVHSASLQTKKLITDSLYFHIQGYLQNTQPFEDIRYGLYFLCNFIDELGYEGIQSQQNIYQSKFCQFTDSQNIQVRNCAVYGLGVFMKLIPVEKTNQQLIYKWLNILWNSLSISFQEGTKKKQFNFARDNIVSALGKLLLTKRQYYPAALNQQVHKKWFENLPLNSDKVQGNQQHQILLTLLEQTPQSFISSKQDVSQLLQIIAKYFLKRIYKSDEIIVKNKQKTKQFLYKMKQWTIFQQNSDFLWNSLPQNHKTTLTKLMQ